MSELVSHKAKHLLKSSRVADQLELLTRWAQRCLAAVTSEAHALRVERLEPDVGGAYLGPGDIAQHTWSAERRRFGTAECGFWVMESAESYSVARDGPEQWCDLQIYSFGWPAGMSFELSWRVADSSFEVVWRFLPEVHRQALVWLESCCA